MPIPKNIFWKFYAILYSLFLVRQSILLFHPESPTSLYFYILRSFNGIFWLSYILAILSLIFEIIQIVPIIGFIYRIPVLSPRIWQYIFITRLFLDIRGNSYEWNQLVALYKMDVQVGLYATLAWIVPVLPSYIASYIYAFRWKKLFPLSQKIQT